MKAKLVKESLANDDGTVTIYIDGYPWYLRKIDSTHFYMSNNEKERGWPYHIAEHNNKSYYNDLRNWLHGKEYPEGKNYVNDPQYTNPDYKSK